MSFSHFILHPLLTQTIIKIILLFNCIRKYRELHFLVFNSSNGDWYRCKHTAIIRLLYSLQYIVQCAIYHNERTSNLKPKQTLKVPTQLIRTSEQPRVGYMLRRQKLTKSFTDSRDHLTHHLSVTKWTRSQAVGRVCSRLYCLTAVTVAKEHL